MPSLIIGNDRRLDIVDDRTGIHRGKDHPLAGRIEVRIQHPQTMRELRFQVWITYRKIDLVPRSGQRLQLRSGRLARPAGLEYPQMRGPGPEVLKVHGGRKVHVITYHRDILGEVLTIIAGELYA